MIKIKHITLNDITQLVKLCKHIGEKNGLAQKEHDQTDCIRLSLQNQPTAVSQRVYQMAEIQEYPLYPISPRKQKC